MWADDSVSWLLDELKTRPFPTEQRARAYRMAVLANGRAYHDPEYWFAANCKVRVKDNKGDKHEVPFILHYPQRILLKVLCDLFFAGTPVRIILVKARQWGGSTLVQLFMAWVQLYRRVGWNMAICADNLGQSYHIREMFSIIQRETKAPFRNFTITAYQGHPNIKYIPERGAIIGVGSVNNPNAIRSFTNHMLHLSEVGLWRSTAVVNAEDLAQSLIGGLVEAPYTMVVKESTANGVGNYFHNNWTDAVKGTSSDTPVFIGWHQIPEYQRPLEIPVADFVASWTDYQAWQWEQGATLEGMAWYEYKLKAIPARGGGDRAARMKAEFPMTAGEAFQGTGFPYFPVTYIQSAEWNCRPPAEVGYLTADAEEGKEALEGIRFVPDDLGLVNVWRRPGDDYAGLVDLETYRITHRYCGFADVGGRTENADWHSMSIYDRLPMCPDIFDEPGPPEVVADINFHMDADLAAWYFARLAAWYEEALLAIEINSYYSKVEEGKDPGASHALTVLDQIAPHYHNLYHRSDPEKIRDRKNLLFGFMTNAKTKRMIMDVLTAGLRTGGYVERNRAALTQMRLYETKPNGRMGARQGHHDDRVVDRAGGLWLAKSVMPTPRRVRRPERGRRRRAMNESSFR